MKLVLRLLATIYGIVILFSYNQFRIGFGFKYEFIKNQSIKLFYTYEKNLEKKEIVNTNICGLKYGYYF